jgi:hypothetical protein
MRLRMSKRFARAAVGLFIRSPQPVLISEAKTYVNGLSQDKNTTPGSFTSGPHKLPLALASGHGNINDSALAELAINNIPFGFSPISAEAIGSENK